MHQIDLEDVIAEAVARDNLVFEKFPPNVIPLETVTTHDLPVNRVLQQAHEAELVEIVICGVTSDGREFVARSCSDLAAASWHLTRAQYLLMRMMDRIDDPIPPVIA